MFCPPDNNSTTMQANLPAKKILESIILTSPHVSCCARIVQQITTTTTRITTTSRLTRLDGIQCCNSTIPLLRHTLAQKVYLIESDDFLLVFIQIKSIASGAAVNKRVILGIPTVFFLIKYTFYRVTWFNRICTISV